MLLIFAGRVLSGVDGFTISAQQCLKKSLRAQSNMQSLIYAWTIATRFLRLSKETKLQVTVGSSVTVNPVALARF